MSARVGVYTYASEAVLGLELLSGIQAVINQSKASGPSTTELGTEAEAEDHFLIDLVHLGKLVADLILGEVSDSGVDDIHDLVQ